MSLQGFRTEALEGHFSYYLQLICYSLIVRKPWRDILVTTYNLFVIA